MIANTIVGAAALLLAVPVTLATPVIKPPCEEYKPFNAIGCYRDGNPRALPLQSNVDATTLTVEKCTASCKGMKTSLTLSNPTQTLALYQTSHLPDD